MKDNGGEGEGENKRGGVRRKERVEMGRANE